MYITVTRRETIRLPKWTVNENARSGEPLLLAKRENGEIDGGNNLDTKGVQRRKLKRCVGVLNLILSWKRNYGIRIKFNDKTIEEFIVRNVEYENAGNYGAKCFKRLCSKFWLIFSGLVILTKSLRKVMIIFTFVKLSLNVRWRV